jgi:hypothetical protein
MVDCISITTIITRDRLAWARTLVDSYLNHHPDGQCFVLVIDDTEGYFDPATEAFELITLEQLNLPELHSFIFKYTPFELCCALKPFVLEYLLKEKHLEFIYYMDSDMMVLSSMNELTKSFEKADLLLTPHLDADFPDDGKKPDDGHVLLSGVFNAGFVGVKSSPEGMDFLSWWKKKLTRLCIEDHFNGYFVDQKYLDLVTGLFECVGVVTDPGCNTAYWNLHSRMVLKKNGVWMSNDRPLVFYHFSDYDPGRPDILSGHQNRFDLHKCADLKKLFDLYRSNLMNNGEKQSGCWEYGFSHYTNGRRISAGARRAYLLHDRFGANGNPFDVSNQTIHFKLIAAWQEIVIRMKRRLLQLMRRC